VTLRALLAALVVLAIAAPAALADDFDQVFKDYAKDGRIDPCKHSAAQLQRARKDVPPDIEQYAPDFPDALDQAIETRARGRCGEKKPAPVGTTPAAPSTSGPVGTKTTPSTATTGANGPTAAAGGAPPAPTPDSAPQGAPTDDAIARAADRSHDTGSDVPAPLIALAILAAALALAALAVGVARWRGWDPPWALRTRHALGEAGWRAGNTWSEFADWVRQAR
jgi:hypothetical protein